MIFMRNCLIFLVIAIFTHGKFLTAIFYNSPLLGAIVELLEQGTQDQH